MTSSRYVLAKSWPQLGLRPGSASSSISGGCAKLSTNTHRVPPGAGGQKPQRHHYVVLGHGDS